MQAHCPEASVSKGEGSPLTEVVGKPGKEEGKNEKQKIFLGFGLVTASRHDDACKAGVRKKSAAKNPSHVLIVHAIVRQTSGLVF
jgi:hypothetical protein